MKSNTTSSSTHISSPDTAVSSPPQEWLLEYIMPTNTNKKEWSLQRVLLTTIAIILYVSAVVYVGISVLSDRGILSLSPEVETCDIQESNNSCSAASEDTNTQQEQQQRHRGRVIDGKNVKASDLAKAYHEIKTEYANLAIHSSGSHNWQILSQHADGSTVSLLEHPTDVSCPYVRMSSIMPGTIQEVWNFLDLSNWDTSMPKMDPFYEGLEIHGEYKHRGIHMKLARKTIKRLVTFGKRDFTFVSVSDHPRGDGAWVSGTVSVVTDEIPRMNGYVRAYQDSIAFYESLENNSKDTNQPQMELTIVFRIDLNDTREGGDGGFVPMWAYVKTVGTTGMASVQNMKRQLELIASARDRESISNDDNSREASCDNSWLARIRNGSTQKC